MLDPGAPQSVQPCKPSRAFVVFPCRRASFTETTTPLNGSLIERISADEQTTNQNRGTGNTAQYDRTQKPRKMDTRPNHFRLWHSELFPCISAHEPRCARTSRWPSLCCSRPLGSQCKT